MATTMASFCSTLVTVCVLSVLLDKVRATLPPPYSYIHISFEEYKLPKLRYEYEQLKPYIGKLKVVYTCQCHSDSHSGLLSE